MSAHANEEHRGKDRVKSSLDRATQIFEEKNLRFTDLRRKVFEEIASTTACTVGTRWGRLDALPGSVAKTRA